MTSRCSIPSKNGLSREKPFFCRLSLAATSELATLISHGIFLFKTQPNKQTSGTLDTRLRDLLGHLQSQWKIRIH